MSRAGLSEQQKQAVRDGDLSRIRRLTAVEMKDSLQGRLLTTFYETSDLKFELTVNFGPDPEVHVDHDGCLDGEQDFGGVAIDGSAVELTDLNEDIAECSTRHTVGPYFAHLFEASSIPSKKNELVIVGSGITGANHLTAEAAAHIAGADRVLYCVADLAIERRLRCLNNDAEDLCVFYGDNKPREQTYEQMVTRILEVLRNHERVCVVFYGHPGIFVLPSFKAVEVARNEGYRARMLPAVSSLDCLFADVGVDPSRHGCQIVEATDMLVRSKRPDISAAVVIFQAGFVGDLGYSMRGYDDRNISVLAEYLGSFYGEDYEVIVYEAAQYPVCRPRVQRVKLSELPDANLSGISTLYIPPKEVPPARADMLSRLGLKYPRAAR